MNTDKANKLLRKIQALYENLSDQGTMSSLERDLLLSYLRDLYEEIAGTPSSAKFSASHEEFHQHAEMFSHVDPEPPMKHADPPPPPPPVIQADPPKPPQETVRHPEPTPAEYQAPPPPPPVTERPAPPPPAAVVEKQHQDEPEPATPVVQASEELNALFAFKQIGELSEKLKLQPLSRVEHGMGINERILLLNELFKGDGILFNKTLSDLNALDSFEEARSYLINGVANTYNWADEARKDRAAMFIELVRRKFIS